MYTGFCKLLVVPSPKFQSQKSTTPVERSVKETVSLAQTIKGFATNAGIGFIPARTPLGTVILSVQPSAVVTLIKIL